MNEKILLVEDNADDELLTLRALKKARIMNEVEVARDGDEAVKYLDRIAAADEHKHLSLILLDLKLPKIDGIKVLEHIKKNPKLHGVPVVVLTTSKEERDLQSCYDLGVNSYIVKPVDVNEFMDAVQKLGTYWLILNEQP